MSPPVPTGPLIPISSSRTPSPMYNSVNQLSAVLGGCRERAVRLALVSVFDKTGIVDFCRYLHSKGVKILSTGGSYKCLKEADIPAVEVADYTEYPELFDGRVKTLHPKIMGGLLFVRNNTLHEEEAANHETQAIDLLVVNLYPFVEAVKSGAHDIPKCIENIDIGGPCLLRAAAKNHTAVCVVSSPRQYDLVKQTMERHDGCSTPVLRTALAKQAFALTAAYDSSVSEYFNFMVGPAAQNNAEADSNQTLKEGEMKLEGRECLDFLRQPSMQSRCYFPHLKLKYGCNPQQNPASVCALMDDITAYAVVKPTTLLGRQKDGFAVPGSLGGMSMPFRVINGLPGYINLMDAALAWQLVRELKESTGDVAAASFKHCSPAGAALGHQPLTAEDVEVFDVLTNIQNSSCLTAATTAYIRARNADAMSSFGDFVGLSDVVDKELAEVLKVEVSDGIVAAGYTAEALKILTAKKGGSFIVLEGNTMFRPPSTEYREIFGMGFMQTRNTETVDYERLKNIVTKNKEIPDASKKDLILASICMKYTQSNSVGYAMGGQMIGVGAGQQSRVDCVKLAGRKTITWHLRRHKKVRSLIFVEGVKRQERVNARVRYIEGDMTASEIKDFNKLVAEIPDPLTSEEKLEYLKTVRGVSVSSDAFFPFRDCIDHMAKFGVQYIAQPGGSMRDEEVTSAADQHGMIMAHTGLRLFLH